MPAATMTAASPARIRHGERPPGPDLRGDLDEYHPRAAIAMPRMTLDTGDAIELAELLGFISHWLACDRSLSTSLLAFVGHPSYGTQQLRNDLDRFAFLLGGNDGEFLLGEDPPNARNRPQTAATSRERKSPVQPAKCGQN